MARPSRSWYPLWRQEIPIPPVTRSGLRILPVPLPRRWDLPQEKIDGIRMAGSIHDIGKLSIPAEILSKPTKLSEIEFSLIKEHARKGYEMLKDVESPWPLAEIVYQHHERMDGSGYPRNLKGEEILHGGPHPCRCRRGGSHGLPPALSSRLGH